MPRRWSAGDPDLVEGEVGGVAGADAHLVPDLDLGEAGTVVGHHEGGNVAPAGAAAFAGEHHGEVGDPAAGDEALGPVDHVLVAVAGGAGLQRAGVGARVGFGQGERAEPQLAIFAGAHRQEAIALLLGADHRDRGGGEPADLGAERNPGAAPRQLLGRDHRGNPGFRRLSAQRDAGQPNLSSFGGDIPGEFVALVVFPSDRADLVGGECVRSSLHKAVGFGQ